MLFGTQKPRGLFGGPDGWRTAPPMTGAPIHDQQMVPMGGQDMTPTTMPAPQGMFGGQQPSAPRQGVNWGGVIADALAGAAGREPAFLNSIMAGREREQKQAEAVAQRQASMQDRMAYHDYTVANPGPQKDDNFTRTLQAAGIDPASPQGVAMYKKRAEMLTNPMQLVPDGYGGVRPVHVNGEMGATGVATDDDWTNAKPMGGGVGNGPGGFPGF